MTSDLTEPRVRGADPTDLPIFSEQRSRPGRVRGRFTLPATDTPSPLDARRDLRTTAVPQPPSAPALGLDAPGLDWDLVRALRTVVAGRLTASLGAEWRRLGAGEANALGKELDRPGQERFGREIISDVLKEHTADAVTSGDRDAWTPGEQARMAQAVFDAVFRLGDC